VSNAILDNLLALEDGIGLCWLGNLAWLVRAEGRLFAFDLDLSPPSPDRQDHRVQASPVPVEDLAPALDVQFVTHAHGDHFNAVTSAVLAERSDCLFVLPVGCLEKARQIGVSQERIRVARPGEPFTLPGVRVEPTRAHHSGHPTPDDCGYVLETAGLRLYQPGDTGLLPENLALSGMDVLFVSPTTHNTHIEDSVRIVQALRPRWIFPQHFGTYVESEQNRFWTRGYPDELRDALPAPFAERYHKLEQGQVFVIEA